MTILLAQCWVAEQSRPRVLVFTPFSAASCASCRVTFLLHLHTRATKAACCCRILILVLENLRSHGQFQIARLDDRLCVKMAGSWLHPRAAQCHTLLLLALPSTCQCYPRNTVHLPRACMHLDHCGVVGPSAYLGAFGDQDYRVRGCVFSGTSLSNTAMRNGDHFSTCKPISELAHTQSDWHAYLAWLVHFAHFAHLWGKGMDTSCEDMTGSEGNKQHSYHDCTHKGHVTILAYRQLDAKHN